MAIAAKIETLILEEIIKPLVGYEEDANGNETFGNEKSVELRITSREKQAKRARFDPARQCFVLSTPNDPHEDTVTITLDGNPDYFAKYVKILSQIHENSLRKSIVTKRDIYYSSAQLFESQTSSDNIIDNVAATLEVTRAELGVVRRHEESSFTCTKVAAAKGEVVGKMRFQSGGNLVDCNGVVTLIPAMVEDISCEGAKFVLVVEKDTVFQKCTPRSQSPNGSELSNSKKSNPVYQKNYHLLSSCILITGKGYPDVATRQLVSSISKKFPKLQIFGLFDADPYGIDILLSYTFGTPKYAREGEALTCPAMKWIGFRPSEMDRLAPNVRDRVCLRMTERDIKTANRILNLRAPSPISQRPDWKIELQKLLEKGIKAELEGLDSVSDTFLVHEYLPAKIYGFSL